MRIAPCTGYKSYINFRNNCPDKKQNKEPDKNYKNFILDGVGIAGTIALGALIYRLSRGKPPSIKHEIPKIRLTASQIQSLKKELQLFPGDIEYRKAILSEINGLQDNYAILRSITGPDEYRSIVKAFSADSKFYSPGDNLITKEKDGYNLSGRTKGTYRANLHIHTVHSDGKMTVKELLDQSAEYADEVYQKIKTNPQTESKFAPFTIAITDHDTVEGCKEAVRIISENPWKYRNLRVVLGCELTVENKTLPEQLKSPVPIHMLLHGINPFDNRLNSLLNRTKNARVDLINRLIKKASEKMKTDYPHTAQKLSYEDARLFCPEFRHRILHVDYSLKDYLQFRTIFSECFENNPKIQQKTIGMKDINYIIPKEKYFDSIKENYDTQYWRKYVAALQKYTADLLGIPENEAAKEIVITPKLEKLLNELEQIAHEGQPNFNYDPAFVDMEEAITFIKNQKYGFMSIAHPGLTGIGNCLKNPAESFQGMYNLFRNFKQKGGDRAISAEIHYHYFGDIAQSREWLNKINQFAAENNLYYGGGIDNHGKNIFYSG